MSKKANKTTAIVVAEPQVQNNINMNLTHNDLIDLAIQSQLEILEPREEELQDLIVKNRKDIQDVHDNVSRQACERSNCPEARNFNQILKMISGKESVIPKVVNRNPDGKRESICSGEYPVVDANCENQKAPLVYFKRYSSKKKDLEHIAESIIFQLEAKVNGVYIQTNNYCRVTLTTKEYASYKAQIEKLLDEKVKLYTEYYEVRKQILELKYNDKKVKARVVKKSLSNTKQGRNILNLLESSTKIKLLE